MMRLWIVVLLSACASCEDTHLKVRTESVLTNPEPVYKFKEPQASEKEKETCTDTLITELVAKVERMEKTINSLEKKISIMNQNSLGYIYSNPDIDQMERDIIETKKDITHLRNVVDINESNIVNVTKHHRADVELLTNYLLTSLPPIGSIIAWNGSAWTDIDIPTGWQRCDGSRIESGILNGLMTPSLNNDELFLRGGMDYEAGTVQQDAIQEHQHVDNGHMHIDAGHWHKSYSEDAPGPSPASVMFTGSDDYEKYIATADYGYRMNFNHYTGNSKASISYEFSGLGGITGASKSTETRPKNMKVVYIMRIG